MDPLTIALIGSGLLGGIFGGKQKQRGYDTANTLNQNQFDMDLFRILSQFAPLQVENARNQQLDPVRNSAISGVGKSGLVPGMDPAVLDQLVAGGTRPDLELPPIPQFRGIEKPGGFTSFIEAGFPLATDAFTTILEGRNKPRGLQQFDAGSPDKWTPNPPQTFS